jgi:hypothetical protein
VAEAVYSLCALTSVVCAVLLLRMYLRRRTRLLLWSSAFFALFAVNNILLFIDTVIVPSRDLALWRNLSALGASLVLVYGLVWETEKDGRR